MPEDTETTTSSTSEGKEKRFFQIKIASEAVKKDPKKDGSESK
jgi:hypothetical protein